MSDAATATEAANLSAEQISRQLRAQLAAVTGGIAPDDYAKAWLDWYLNVSQSPEKSAALAKSAADKALDTWQFALAAGTGQTHKHEVADTRVAGEAWNQWPFNVYARAYGNLLDWWQEALRSAPGMVPANAARFDFMARQALNAASPANYLATNPDLLEHTRAESGANLVRGFRHWLEDASRAIAGGAPPGTEQFRVGEQVAVTPGKVVLQNELMELIQYSPLTDNVYAEPVLITPAWIMKYYILDLSPRNSLVRYLLEQGHTVFMISWKNPTAADRNLGMDDYLRLGLVTALNAVTAIVPGRRAHAVGYCIGGTLLAIGAAALAASHDQRIASITLFAAQTDFSEPGELSLFISPSQLAMLEAMMQQKGVLASEQMGAAFALLRSADLIWNPAVDKYVRGQRAPLNDLMAWNADGTRMPCRMHSEYLSRLYLNNELAQGQFAVNGRPVSLGSLTVPLFVVGTETDHVAPWRSVYKARALTRSPDYTFLLTSGGHNAGIISGPVNAKRRHRTLHLADAQRQVSAADFELLATPHQGSWWPTWERWLAAHSGSTLVAPPSMGDAGASLGPLRDAPGAYVRG